MAKANQRNRARISVALALALAGWAIPTNGETITLTGTNGTTGSTGSGSNGPAGPGGPGQSVIANANSTHPSNAATATGGNGYARSNCATNGYGCTLPRDIAARRTASILNRNGIKL